MIDAFMKRSRRTLAQALAGTAFVGATGTVMADPDPVKQGNEQKIYEDSVQFNQEVLRPADHKDARLYQNPGQELQLHAQFEPNRVVGKLAFEFDEVNGYGTMADFTKRGWRLDELSLDLLFTPETKLEIGKLGRQRGYVWQNVRPGQSALLSGDSASYALSFADATGVKFSYEEGLRDKSAYQDLLRFSALVAWTVPELNGTHFRTWRNGQDDLMDASLPSAVVNGSYIRHSEKEGDITIGGELSVRAAGDDNTASEYSIGAHAGWKKEMHPHFFLTAAAELAEVFNRNGDSGNNATLLSTVGTLEGVFNISSNTWFSTHVGVAFSYDGLGSTRVPAERNPAEGTTALAAQIGASVMLSDTLMITGAAEPFSYRFSGPLDGKAHGYMLGGKLKF